jgi:hypothetical protein
VATTLMLGLCNSTSLYGFGEYKNQGEKAEYHYYNGLGALIKGPHPHQHPEDSRRFISSHHIQFNSASYSIPSNAISSQASWTYRRYTAPSDRM